jgi:hypothetical protein
LRDDEKGIAGVLRNERTYYWVQLNLPAAEA